MKQLILIGLLLVNMRALHAAPPPPPRPLEPAVETKQEPFISSGERIEIPEVGFSIVPPNGWMVNKNAHGSSLLFEAPKLPNQTYQPTLQVMVFSKHRYIDEVTMKEYGDLIVEKFGKISNRVTGYRLRDAAFQQLETGDPSILYYTEFQYDDVPIMQMHILVSSATNHFMMTYTDLTKVFEDEASPGLVTAYTSMHSAQLATRPPWRWRDPAMVGGGVLLLILAWFTLRTIRSRRLARLGQRIEEEGHREMAGDEESRYNSRHPTASHGVSEIGDDWKAGRTSSKDEPQKKLAEKASPAYSSHFGDDDDDDEEGVSEVVPISMLEKSRHPARKPRQETMPEPRSMPPQSFSRHQSSGVAPVSQHPVAPQPGRQTQPPLPPPVPMGGPAQPQPVSEHGQSSVMSREPQVHAVSSTPGYSGSQASPSTQTPDVQLPSQAPAFEQPAYAHPSFASEAPAVSDPLAGRPAPMPAPMVQTQAAAPKPIMPEMRSAHEPESMQPTTASRLSRDMEARNQPRSHEIDDELEMSEEARLSEILPKAGAIETNKPKRKGLFWRKKTEDDEDQDAVSNVSWPMGSEKKAKGRDEDEDADAADNWDVAPGSDAIPDKDDDASAESDSWASGKGEKSESKKDSRLREEPAPQRAARQAPAAPAAQAHDAGVTEDGWNLGQSASTHDDEDEEEVG